MTAARYGPVALFRGFLAGAVIGTTLCAFIVSIIIETVPLLLASLSLPVVYGVFFFLAGMPRRAREAAIVPLVALAKIESVRAGGTETGDVPVDLDLTVAPDGAATFRTKITHSVNLVDLSEYRTGRVLVIEYPPDRPWKAKVVQRPSPDWERRVADAIIESAPESSPAQEPSEGCAYGALTLLGLLLGAAAVLLAFRVELFGTEVRVGSEEPSTSSTTTSSSGSATVTVDRSLLDEGELRRAIDALAGAADVSQVITVVVEERKLTVVFAPSEAQVPRFDLRAMAVDRVPALVRRATSTLRVGVPQTWQVTGVPFGTDVSLRVVVSGPEGSGAVVDGQ
ncbi:hypothetical protein [Amycolatopsis pittospori]|uniref:hypothetical protein n=1 Tax=Amycolatopsis pittospori TaxID=2749434 RepID=UPI0015F10D69|nr:hypothetical protein [Amycolatopsis pittospori]